MKSQAIGDILLGSIIEREGPWRGLMEFFPTCDRELALAHLARMPPIHFDRVTGKLALTFQTYVLRTPHHTILVDTCVGDQKGYPPPYILSPQPWLQGLAGHGIAFEDVDFVFCTHLHIDHTGWNTRLIDGRWVPTFPNAKYVFSKREYDFWAGQTQKNADPLGAVWTNNCLPVVEAGQALLVQDDFALDDTLWLSPVQGHTPGHVCINLSSRGRKAIITGDVVHHALQVAEPDWSSRFCLDPKMAALSRKRMLEALVDTDTLVCPIHFPGPTVGHVVSDGRGWSYRFKED